MYTPEHLELFLTEQYHILSDDITTISTKLNMVFNNIIAMATNAVKYKDAANRRYAQTVVQLLESPSGLTVKELLAVTEELETDKAVRNLRKYLKKEDKYRLKSKKINDSTIYIIYLRE